VAEAASIYLSFTRDMATVRGGFADAEAIQAALRRGSAYDPDQLSRGLVAYASILALQSPEFVSGVRQYATHPVTRTELAANINADPRWALTLPGADAAAGLIMTTLRQDIDALSEAANSVENDAYTIQNRWDPRRSWAVAHLTNRVERLEAAKAASARPMLPSGPDAARLLAAARTGSGLGVRTDRRVETPYPPVVARALALAALAALGEAGNGAKAQTDALQYDAVSQTCLLESKLNLFQCLAASRPSYEDMFCIGRHIVRDLATCTRGASQPSAIVTVSDVEVAPEPRAPAVTVAPLEGAPAAAPARTPAPVQTPAPQPTLSPTERLNTSPGR
jgi:hypothetical protein